MKPHTVGMCCLALALAGCNTPTGTYLYNRGSDLTDVVHVDLLTNRFGILANFGPAIVGYEGPAFTGVTEAGKGCGYALQLGVGAGSVSATSGQAYGVLLPLSQFEARGHRWMPFLSLDLATGACCPSYPILWEDVILPESQLSFSDPPSGYGRQTPGWGSVGMEVSFILGVGAHADVVELADFVAGWFGQDISGDDL